MNNACSPITVKRIMESMGYNRRMPQRRFAIRPANQPISVAWCQGRLDWTYKDCLRVLWTDKSTLSTAGIAHQPWVTRKASEEYNSDCIDSRYESGPLSWMVWGVPRGTAKSDLVSIPGKDMLDSALYVQNLIESHLIPFWHQCCEVYG